MTCITCDIYRDYKLKYKAGTLKLRIKRNKNIIIDIHYASYTPYYILIKWHFYLMRILVMRSRREWDWYPMALHNNYNSLVSMPRHTNHHLPITTTGPSIVRGGLMQRVQQAVPMVLPNLDTANKGAACKSGRFL